MKPQTEMNLALCRWAGWRKVESPTTIEWCAPGCDYPSWEAEELPDHFDQVDGYWYCALLEAKLTEEQWEQYADELLWAHGKDSHSCYSACRLGLTATPAHRATALYEFFCPEEHKTP